MFDIFAENPYLIWFNCNMQLCAFYLVRLVNTDVIKYLGLYPRTCQSSEGIVVKIYLQPEIY